MKKISNRVLSMIVVGLIAVIFNVLVFVIKDMDNAGGNFWGGYAFTMVAFAVIAGLMFFTKLNKNAIANVFAPIYIISFVYLAITLVLNCIFICLDKDTNPTAMIVINVILLLVYIIIAIVIFMGMRHITNDSKKVYENVKNLKTVAIKVSSLTYLAKDADIKSKIMALKEAVDYSDPMGVEETKGVETEFEGQIDVIKMLLTSNADAEALNDAINGATALLEQRNAMLRAAK